jgi:hypothetical protein
MQTVDPTTSMHGCWEVVAEALLGSSTTVPSEQTAATIPIRARENFITPLRFMAQPQLRLPPS